MCCENKIKHPGVILGEFLNDLDETPQEFSEVTGISVKTIESLLAEKRDITEDIAEKIAKECGTSAAFWINLQIDYNKRKVIIDKN